MLVALCQYITDKSFIPTQCLLNCGCIRKISVLNPTTFIYTVPVYKAQQFFPHTFGYTVLLYQVQHFLPHILSITMCHFIRNNGLILTHLPAMCHYYRHNIISLTYYLLHPFSVSQSIVLASHIVGTTVSVYQRQQFYHHTLLATLCQYIKIKMYIVTFIGYNVSVCQGHLFYPHTLYVTRCQYIRDYNFIPTHFWLHCVCISETTGFPH